MDDAKSLPPASKSSDGPPTPDGSSSATPRGKAGLVSIAIMLSRILGLIREVALAAFFGASHWMDAFMVAFRTPNMLRDLFAEGALSVAFVTTFTQKIKTEGEESAWDLARKIITLTTVFMAGVTVLGILLAPVILSITVPGWLDEPEKFQFTVLLSRVIYGFIALISLAALAMGILNSKGVFFIPALASSFFNLGSIVSGAIIGYLIDPTFGKDALVGFAVGVLVGGLCQLLVQIPSLRKVGFHFRPDFKWNTPGVRRVLTLMGPAVISGSAVQVGVMLNQVFASMIEYQEGVISSLQWAFRLIMLPIGVFGVAVATVTLPAASRAATDGISEEFRNILARGIRLVMLLTLPSAVGLILLAGPIIALIYGHGRFDAQDTVQTAAVLRFYAIGLTFFSAMKVIQPTFYAIDRKWIPMIVSLVSVVVTAILNTIWVVVLKLEVQFLALSVAIGSMVNFFSLYFVMRKSTNGLNTGKLLSTLGRLGIACLAMAAVVYAGQKWLMLESQWFDMNLLLQAITLLTTIGVAGAVYFITARLLRVEETDEFVSMLKRKVSR